MTDTEEKRLLLSDRHWWFSARRRPALDLVSACLRPGASLLDAGSGAGDVAEAARDLGYQVVCIDVSPGAVERRRRRGLVAQQANIVTLPFPDESFDGVMTLDVLEHLADDVRALAELRRVLKVGGLLLANVPAFPCLWSPHGLANGHLRRYRRGELREKLEATGYAVQRSIYWNWLGFLPILVLRK